MFKRYLIILLFLSSFSLASEENKSSVMESNIFYHQLCYKDGDTDHCKNDFSIFEENMNLYLNNVDNKKFFKKNIEPFVGIDKFILMVEDDTTILRIYNETIEKEQDKYNNVMIYFNFLSDILKQSQDYKSNLIAFKFKSLNTLFEDLDFSLIKHEDIEYFRNQLVDDYIDYIIHDMKKLKIDIKLDRYVSKPSEEVENRIKAIYKEEVIKTFNKINNLITQKEIKTKSDYKKLKKQVQETLVELENDYKSNTNLENFMKNILVENNSWKLELLSEILKKNRNFDAISKEIPTIDTEELVFEIEKSLFYEIYSNFIYNMVSSFTIIENIDRKIKEK